MDKRIRGLQEKALIVFGNHPVGFALAGGTALELYYLHHRFSRDLDFFSTVYNIKEIEALVAKFKKEAGIELSLESEAEILPGRAKMRIYMTKEHGNANPLKIDFVEEVIFKKPSIKIFQNVPVYDIEQIYSQKIFTVIGTVPVTGETGREIAGGRREARDAFDIYVLSQKILPLHKFIKKFSHAQQRALVHWYRTFSRYDLKMGILDLDIYDKKFDVKNLLRHFDDEIMNIVEVGL